MENKDMQRAEFTAIGLKIGLEATKKTEEMNRLERHLEDIEHEIEQIIHVGRIEDMKSPQELIDAVHSRHLDEKQTAQLYDLLFKHAVFVEDYYKLSDELKKLADKIHAASVMVRAIDDNWGV